MLFMSLFILFTIVVPCHGWYLDASCKSREDNREAYVKRWIEGAFELSKAASHALDQLERDRLVPERRRGEMHLARFASIDSLFNSLYRFILSPGVIPISIPPLDHPDWILVKDRFKQINALEHRQQEHIPMDDPAHRYLGLPNSEVIVHCDYSRFRIAEQCFTRAWNPGYACDTAVGLDVKMDQTFVDCQDSLDSPTSEVAWSQPAVSIEMPNSRPSVQMPAQIQICPGYLRDTLSQKPLLKSRPYLQVVEDIRDQLSKKINQLDHRFETRFKARFPSKSVNDMVMQGDGRMLYSLLSTLPQGPGAVDGPNSMGFDNCVRLSGVKDVKNDGTDRSRALDNTENYVFFAINCALINAPPGKTRMAIIKGSLSILNRQNANGQAETE